MTAGRSTKSRRTAERDAVLDLGVPSTPANSFITDIGMWFAQERSNWLATATWISLLGTLGIVTPTARTALHRMTKGGYLQREARGGRPGYGLSDAWVEYLGGTSEEAGSETDSDHAWGVLTFSIPETERSARHALRTLLSRRGFASIGNAIWVAPASRLPATRLALQTGGFADRVEIFRAEYDGFADVDDFARRHWDVETIASMYRGFIREVRPRLRRKPEANPRTFADVVVTINTWRRINFEDPGLPGSALPQNWPREEARSLRDDLVARSLKAARDYVAAVERGSNG